MSHKGKILACLCQLGPLEQNFADWWLKEQTYISQNSGSREVQNQGAGKFNVGRGLSSWFADMCLHVICSHALPLVHVGECSEKSCVSSSCYKGIIPIIRISLSWLILITSHSPPLPNIIILGIRASTYTFLAGDTCIWSIKLPKYQKTRKFAFWSWAIHDFSGSQQSCMLNSAALPISWACGWRFNNYFFKNRNISKLLLKRDYKETNMQMLIKYLFQW